MGKKIVFSGVDFSANAIGRDVPPTPVGGWLMGATDETLRKGTTLINNTNWYAVLVKKPIGSRKITKVKFYTSKTNGVLVLGKYNPSSETSVTTLETLQITRSGVLEYAISADFIDGEVLCINTNGGGTMGFERDADNDYTFDNVPHSSTVISSIYIDIYVG